MLFLSFFSGTLFGQTTYLKLIEKGKLDKAEKKINKSLKKEPNDIVLNYAMSSLMMKRQFKGYDIELSYEFLIKSEKLYTKISEEKEINKLNKIPINKLVILNYLDTICRYALNDAIERNSLESYESYLSYFIRASSEYKNTSVIKRDIAAFLIATKENTVESFENFILKYPKAKQITEAITKRNSLAYSISAGINTISSYKTFINKYPDAAEVNEAWERIYNMAYDEAKETNTIEAFEDFIANYPKAKHVEFAINKIHELAFEIAKSENTSNAFKTFIDKYPKSKQFDSAKDLFYCRQFEENTSDGMWESYEIFFNSFDSPYRNNAIDSIYNIAAEGNYKALEFILKNNHKNSNRNDLISSYFNVIKNRGEYSEIMKFHNEFYEIIDESSLSEIKSILKIAKEAEDLKLDLPYNVKNRARYIDFIKRSGDIDLNFVILQRVISNDISEKKYENATKTLNSLEHLFVKNSNLVISLKNLLKNSYDNSIKPIPLFDINTKGNEYSPVISADNKSLFFCGKDREIDIKNEQIYCSHLSKDSWTTSTIIETGSLNDVNNAPLANSSDGNTLFIFSEGQIYESNKTKYGWSNLNLLDNQINTNSWEGDLTISSDNNTLIFARGNAMPEKNIDIVFLVDASGSMQPCIYGVQENIYNFIDGIQMGDVIVKWRAKVIYYRDFQSDEANSFINNPFTNNIEELQTQLNHDASGGGDEPESTFESIYKTIKETDWNNSEYTTRFIINFTDASNKEWISPQSVKKFGKIDANQILKSLKSDKIKLILFGQNEYQYYALNSEYADVTLYDNAVSELQNADYAVIMNELSQKVSLLASNTLLYHGDRLPLSDLYICHKNQKGQWGKILKMPSVINTPYTERSPFLHPDMKTLYFSSDGHGGLGKLDVFMTKRLADSCWNCWSEPINLGKEINGSNSDWGYKISTDGQTAYFSKDSKSKSREDIYKITLPPHLRPDVVARVEGQLKNTDNKPISTSIHWEDLGNNKIIGTAKTDPKDGTYFIVLPMGKNYGYFIEDSSYFPISQNLDLRDSTKAIVIKKDVQVVTFEEMIEKGISVPMNNLFFDFAKHYLLSTSIPELKRIAKLINRYNLKVVISGHTDNVGEDKSNQLLSERRAKSVKDFLILCGCNENLLQTIGYGESKPIDTNENEIGRANNRRVEIKFIK